MLFAWINYHYGGCQMIFFNAIIQTTFISWYCSTVFSFPHLFIVISVDSRVPTSFNGLESVIIIMCTNHFKISQQGALQDVFCIHLTYLHHYWSTSLLCHSKIFQTYLVPFLPQCWSHFISLNSPGPFLENRIQKWRSGR